MVCCYQFQPDQPPSPDRRVRFVAHDQSWGAIVAGVSIGGISCTLVRRDGEATEWTALVPAGATLTAQVFYDRGAPVTEAEAG